MLPRLAQFIILAGLLAGCGKKANDEIDFGTINNSTYSNNYFGLTVTLPADWSVQDQEAQKRLMGMAGNLVAGDDKNEKALIKASELQTFNLFAAFKYPIGSPVPANPTVLALAEKVSQLPGIKQGKDYLYHVRQGVESSQIKMTFPKDIYPQKLGGVDFDVMDAQLAMNGKTVNEKYYCTIKKGYALTFIVAFESDQLDPAQQKFLDSVAFK